MNSAAAASILSRRGPPTHRAISRNELTNPQVQQYRRWQPPSLMIKNDLRASVRGEGEPHPSREILQPAGMSNSGKNMTLEELINQLTDADDDLTVYASEPWSTHSDAIAVPDIDGTTRSDAQGRTYLLEVFLIHDVLETWKAHRDGTEPSPRQACEAVIHYAQNDAYLFPDEDTGLSHPPLDQNGLSLGQFSRPLQRGKMTLFVSDSILMMNQTVVPEPGLKRRAALESRTSNSKRYRSNTESSKLFKFWV
jgi:hypothetical protein